MNWKKKNIILENVEKFNEKNKSIVYLKKGFAIAYSQTLSHLGVLESFSYEGYIINDKLKRDPINRYVIHMECDVNYDDKLNYIKSIYIIDFIADSSIRDQGYGSIIMNCLIEYAQRLNIEYIYGRLSFVDIGKEYDETDIEKINNRERLYHFYTKHGFVINGKRIERTMINKSWYIYQLS